MLKPQKHVLVWTGIMRRIASSSGPWHQRVLFLLKSKVSTRISPAVLRVWWWNTRDCLTLVNVFCIIFARFFDAFYCLLHEFLLSPDFFKHSHSVSLRSQLLMPRVIASSLPSALSKFSCWSFMDNRVGKASGSPVPSKMSLWISQTWVQVLAQSLRWGAILPCT